MQIPYLHVLYIAWISYSQILKQKNFVQENMLAKITRTEFDI